MNLSDICRRISTKQGSEGSSLYMCLQMVSWQDCHMLIRRGPWRKMDFSPLEKNKIAKLFNGGQIFCNSKGLGIMIVIYISYLYLCEKLPQT